MRPTIQEIELFITKEKELESLIGNEEEMEIEILPNGEVRAKRKENMSSYQAGVVQPITKNRYLGDAY